MRSLSSSNALRLSEPPLPKKWFKIRRGKAGQASSASLDVPSVQKSRRLTRCGDAKQCLAIVDTCAPESATPPSHVFQQIQMNFYLCRNQKLLVGHRWRASRLISPRLLHIETFSSRCEKTSQKTYKHDLVQSASFPSGNPSESICQGG